MALIPYVSTEIQLFTQSHNNTGYNAIASRWEEKFSEQEVREGGRKEMFQRNCSL
jgi:hypothetical protein